MANLGNIKMKSVDLIDAITRNLKQHKVDVAEARVDRRDAIATEFKKEVSKMKKNGLYQPDTHFSFDRVSDYTKDYTRALSMLRDGIEEEVELNEHQYDKLVLDNWGWTEDFKMSNKSYKS